MTLIQQHRASTGSNVGYPPWPRFATSVAGGTSSARTTIAAVAMAAAVKDGIEGMMVDED